MRQFMMMAWLEYLGIFGYGNIPSLRRQDSSKAILLRHHRAQNPIESTWAEMVINGVWNIYKYFNTFLI